MRESLKSKELPFDISPEEEELVIFISHRSTDKDIAIAEMLVDFFVSTGILKDYFFCSSISGIGVKEKIPSEIREKLTRSVVNIVILSMDYYKSAYCMNEAGIIWYLNDKSTSNVKVVPIALPDVNKEDMCGFLNSDYKFFRLDYENDIAAIFDTVREAISAPQPRSSLTISAKENLKKDYLEWRQKHCGSSSEINTYLNDFGIKKIHLKGQSVESFESVLRSDRCKEIKIFALSAQGFIHYYREDLTQFVARGGNLKLLLAKDDTLFIRQASEMENRNARSIGNTIELSMDILHGIYRDAEEIARLKGSINGTIEVRLFDTEMRNPVIICSDIDNITTAWLSILIPPLPAINCNMIEYSDVEPCMKYFNKVWSRHEQDVRMG